ncbi:hypothetical protein [Pseudomonas serbica]|uniref:hypothetical protein n=1 Tax=Pseudomonas serbica TaxID=2965074 RepID=UPI00237A432E|nr:hypothetical protein [Pseudomonas serbica]
MADDTVNVQQEECAVVHLERLAQAATQGEWVRDKRRYGGVIYGGPIQHWVNGSGQSQIAMTTGAEWMRAGEHEANADFIAAANPAAILGLIARARQSEQDFKDVVGTIELRDIEIRRLQAENDRLSEIEMEYNGCMNIKAELAEMFDCVDEPRWKWIMLGIGSLKREHDKLQGEVKELRAENVKLRGPEETVVVCEKGKPFTFMSKDPCRYSLCEVTYAVPVRVLIEERDQLKVEVEALRAVATLSKLLPELDDALEDLEIHGQHSDQGYRKLKDWYRKVGLACKVAQAPMFSAEHGELVSQNEWLRRQIESIAGQHAPLMPIPDKEGWSCRLPGYDLVSLLRDAERFRWLNDQRASVWHILADMPLNHTGPYIDDARRQLVLEVQPRHEQEAH